MTVTDSSQPGGRQGPFNERSPRRPAAAHTGSSQRNAASTPHGVQTERRETVDPSDYAQAAVFVDMLAAEIIEVSVRVDNAEQLSRAAHRAGQRTARLWHDEEARTQRALLYELHRQLDALHRRFPSAVSPTWSDRYSLE